MIRTIKIALLVLLIGGCKEHPPQPPLSGLLWGGEGSRLLLQSIVDSTKVNDTLLVNHLGEFSWLPDSFASGLYRLSKMDGRGTIVVLEANQPLYVDGQYFSFPNQAKITGGVSSDGFTRIEKFSDQWRSQLDETISSVIDSKWKPTDAEVQKLHAYLDSIDVIYKALIYQKEDHPLERMYALIQSSSSRHLYNMINDSSIFLSTAKSLSPYKNFPLVDRFLTRTKELEKVVYQRKQFQPGNEFPLYLIADTSALNQLKGHPIYIELYNSAQTRYKNAENIALRYANSQLRICEIDLNNRSQTTYTTKSVIHYYPTLEDIEILVETIPLLQMPANFIVDRNGVIVASDIWNKQLIEVLDRLLVK